MTNKIFHVHWCEKSPPERLQSGSTIINIWWCYNCSEVHVHNIFITKLWALGSYFLYLHDFLITLFSSRTVQFSVLFHESNLIHKLKTDWVEYSTQYSLVIYKCCSIEYLVSCHPSCKRFCLICQALPWYISFWGLISFHQHS